MKNKEDSKLIFSELSSAIISILDEYDQIGEKEDKVNSLAKLEKFGDFRFIGLTGFFNQGYKNYGLFVFTAVLEDSKKIHLLTDCPDGVFTKENHIIAYKYDVTAKINHNQYKRIGEDIEDDKVACEDIASAFERISYLAEHSVPSTRAVSPATNLVEKDANRFTTL